MPPCAATVWERVGNSLVMHLRAKKEEGEGEEGERSQIIRGVHTACFHPNSSKHELNFHREAGQIFLFWKKKGEHSTYAVLRPCSDKPMAARRPAPPAPTTTASNSWSMML